MNYTITEIWRAKWYKRPFLWLLGKPTKTISVYHDVKLTSMELTINGETTVARVDFEGEV